MGSVADFEYSFAVALAMLVVQKKDLLILFPFFLILFTGPVRIKVIINNANIFLHTAAKIIQL